jgi:hypothetical protein
MPNEPLALPQNAIALSEEANDEPSARDLIEIAAALQRIEAELGADTSPEPDAFAAIERIADVAFVLHERAVELTLCDELDAALRELSKAGAHSEDAAKRARNTAELLRVLTSRVGEMIARRTGERGRQPPPAEDAATGTIEAREEPDSDARLLEALIESGEQAQSALFEIDAEQTETFAQAVAALVGSLASLDAPAAPDQDGESGQPTVEMSPSMRLLPPLSGLAAVRKEDPAEPPAYAAQAETSAAADRGLGQTASGESAVLPSPALPNAAAADPLAAVRALSEDELIALFS